MAVDHKARTVFLCRRFKIRQIVATARFSIGERENEFAGHDARKVFLFLCVRTALQKATAADHARHVGLDHEAFAKLFHDDHGVDRTAAEAAILFAERRHHQAEFSKLHPHVLAPAFR